MFSAIVLGMTKMSLFVVKDLLIHRFIRRLVTKQTPESTPKPTTSSELTLKDLMFKLEPIFVSLQSLLIWEKPYLSAIAFVVFNCLYWFFVFFNRFRLYCYLFFGLFCIQFIKLWTQYIWPEIRVPPNESTDSEGFIPVHPQVLSAPELNYYINELCVMTKALVLWLVRLRREKHLKFFITTTSLLLMTAIIGKLVPGVIIVYSIMMTMALGPGIALYVMPEGLYDLLKNFFLKHPNDEDMDSNEGTDENSGADKVEDISLRQHLSESALHQYLIRTQFKDYELNPFESEDKTNDSSLQLLSDTQLDITLDRELGIEAQLSDDDIKLDSHSSASSTGGGIRFVSSHFSRNSSSDDMENDFELISDSEIQDFAKGSKTNR